MLRGQWWWWGPPIAVISIFIALFLPFTGLDRIANPAWRRMRGRRGGRGKGRREQGAGGKEQGARGKEQEQRGKEQGAGGKEQGARGKGQGDSLIEPVLRR
ncbi:MAG: hypothetical protein U0350_26550 [Caldilineaceae bacterium]